MPFNRILAPLLLVTSMASFVRADLQTGDPAPDFTLPSSDGGTYQLTKLVEKGPVVLVFSHAAGYPPCIGQMKSLQRRHADFKDAGAQIVAVFRQDKDGIEGLKKIRTGTQVEFLLLTDYEARLTAPYSTNGYAAYVIDGAGKLHAVIPGTKTDRPDVNKLLEEIRKLKKP